jgi:hypothetical protein
MAGPASMDEKGLYKLQLPFRNNSVLREPLAYILQQKEWHRELKRIELELYENISS